MNSLTIPHQVVLETIAELEPTTPRDVEWALVGDGDTDGLYVYPIVAELVVASRAKITGNGLSTHGGRR